MGKEYLKWSARTTPVHNTTLPFTRMLAGPHGLHSRSLRQQQPRELCSAQHRCPWGWERAPTSWRSIVVFESPFEMVSDYPEHYQGQEDFDFIKQVPATWDEVRVLSGRPMENITLARRSGKDWYVGSTDQLG